ncbi:hypothetical protein Rahaq2_3654 [Rahnella aquatilis CIP 78.65 = ATCC 33071]|uniref:Uncharacterized protein n=1 Tax=Rahnella aquatilis (strain ATCC 33071 / DSM 4594 / JCM 1683 / NBRC 105701 / NCIMB 13365 / CIP 78.65) TaxID=745277 RepID=H2IPE0_RAHAC|nr:hypothetical protein Rahaq2_3654 [Rahnella aquatilis CIP 78.65 = ATCC 33071]
MHSLAFSRHSDKNFDSIPPVVSILCKEPPTFLLSVT